MPSSHDDGILHPTTQARRHSERGSEDRRDVDAILDRNYLCHLAVVENGFPVSLPSLYVRDGNYVYLHGAARNQSLRIADGTPCSISVAEVSELVLAQTMFNHSVNYSAVVIFARGEVVESLTEKDRLLTQFVDTLYPGRPQQLRGNTRTELLATRLVRFSLDRSSAKVRTGPPAVEEEAARAWLGNISITMRANPHCPHPKSPKEASAVKLGRPFGTACAP